MGHKVHKIAEWVMPICERYENWLLRQNRIKEAHILHTAVIEMDKHYFRDWNTSPFEVKVACKYNWMNAFMVLVQGLGYPNLCDVGYANDLQ